MTREERNEYYREVFAKSDVKTMRQLCKTDLYFLLKVACQRADVNNDWLYARCNEVQANPDGYLDLWSRDHYKSTIITFGLTIQEILNNPNTTIGIFSHTRPIAKAFLAQIKNELEKNKFLRKIFEDILYDDPKKEAPKWSLDDGICVKRTDNPKEQTIEAWGLVDGQPTSKHYAVLVYDDVVTRESVTTPDMIHKVTDAWALSLNLKSGNAKVRYVGTRYHAADTYATIMERKAAKPRIYAATDDGQFTGKPVFWTQDVFNKKCEEMGSYVAAAQLLLNPVSDKAQSFNKDWLRFYDFMRDFTKWNVFILVDAANDKKKTSDFTVMTVLGLAPDNNYYLLHAIRDRMNLVERCSTLFSLVRQWRPIHVGYEQYGMMADIQHIRYVQEQENFRFHIVPLGGAMPKIDRIKRLVPVLEKNRLWLPHRLPFISVDGKIHDYIAEFLRDEYETFPVCVHDDMLDCLARVLDIDQTGQLICRFPLVTSDIPITIPFNSAQEFAKSEYNPLEGVK